MATRPVPAFTIPRPVAGGAACASLMGLTAWTVLAGGWANNAGGAAVVAVAAAVEGTLLARAAVPRIVAVLAAPVLALAAILPTTIGAMPFDGNPAAAHTVQRYIAALFGGLGTSSDWSFTVGLCAVLWLCGYWLAWMSLRERRGVLAVLPVYAVLATNVLNTKSPDNVALPEALSVAFTLLVIAIAHLESLQAHWTTRRVSALPGTRTRFATSVAITAVALTIAALLIPSLSSTDISAKFFPGPGPGGNPGSGYGGPSVQFSSSTVPGGPLLDSAQTVMTYTTSSSAPLYLGIVADTYFSDGSWYQGPTNGANNDYAEATIPFAGGQLPRDLNVADGGVGADETTVSATIKIFPGATGNQQLAPFPGDPESINQPSDAVGVAPLSQSSPQLLTVDEVQLSNADEGGTVINTSGFVSTATVAQLEAAGRDYPAFVKQQDLQLDNDAFDSQFLVKQIAEQWTAGATNPYDEAEDIQDHLRDQSEFTYSLNPPDPPSGEWAILYFLQETHAGYCQYFASTMGTMLRILGIPARLVTGYGPGVSGESSSQNDLYSHIISSSDAHVWVEAYFPGYGWIPFEPTPASSDGNYTPFERGEAAGHAPAANGDKPSTKPSTKPGFGGPSGPTPTAPAQAKPASAAGVVLIAVAGAVIALLLLTALYLALPRSPRGVWRRLEVLGLLCGTRRRPHETHLEYSRRFETTLAPTLGTPLQALAAELGREHFSLHGGDAAQRRRVLTLWRQVVTRAPRLIARSLRHPQLRQRLSGV